MVSSYIQRAALVAIRRLVMEANNRRSASRGHLGNVYLAIHCAIVIVSIATISVAESGPFWFPGSFPLVGWIARYSAQFVGPLLLISSVLIAFSIRSGRPRLYVAIADLALSVTHLAFAISSVQ